MLVVLALGALLVAPGCNEILGLCPDGTDGLESKACFLRACPDGDEVCTVGPALAGAELELVVRVRDTEATDLRVLATRDDGVAVRLLGSDEVQSCFRAESQAQPTGDAGSDPLGGEECEWRGRITTPSEGMVSVVVLDQNGTEIDHTFVDVRRPERLEVLLVESMLGTDLHDPKRVLLAAGEDGVYDLPMRPSRDVYLVPSAYDAEGVELAAVNEAFDYIESPRERISANPSQRLSGMETDALLVPVEPGEATVTVKTRNTDSPISADVKLRIAP